MFAKLNSLQKFTLPITHTCKFWCEHWENVQLKCSKIFTFQNREINAAKICFTVIFVCAFFATPGNLQLFVLINGLILC